VVPVIPMQMPICYHRSLAPIVSHENTYWLA
jgi:hypothetical protein